MAGDHAARLFVAVGPLDHFPVARRERLLEAGCQRREAVTVNLAADGTVQAIELVRQLRDRIGRQGVDAPALRCTALAVMRQLVPRDSAQPAGERSSLVIGSQLLPSRHERLLHKVVRGRGVVDAGPDEGRQAQLVLADQDGEYFFPCALHLLALEASP